MILKINDRLENKQVDFFDSFTLTLRHDAIASSFGFSGYFNPDNQEHVDIYCIGHYHIVTLFHNGELLLTGNILKEEFSSSKEKKLVTFTGGSLTDVLEHCEIPTSLYPLQSDSLSLRQIAQKLLAPFKIQMVVDSSVAQLMDGIFDTSTAKETQTIKGYLTELAKQKNILITHNEKGQLVFTKAGKNKTPILNYGDDGLPCPDMKLNFDGQAMHSHITVIKEQDPDGGGNAGESTVRNPFVINSVYRPKVVVQSSGDDNDTEQAAKNILAAELQNLKLMITTDRWELDGKVIKPGNYITVVNPDAYLQKRSTWFIEQVDLKGDSQSTTAVLTCVIPEVYNGNPPNYLWKGINLH